MQSDDPTPSAFKHVPNNPEHQEAKQAAINKEREDYVKSLTLEEQAKFKALEQAVSLLEGAQVPYYLWAAPENAKEDRIHMWFYVKQTFKDPYSDEGIKETCSSAEGFITACMKFLTKFSHTKIALYSEENDQLVAFYKREPDKS